MQYNTDVVVLKGPDEPPFALPLMSAALLAIAGAGTSAIALMGAVCSIISLPLGNEPCLWFPVMLIAAGSTSGERTNSLSSRPSSELTGREGKRDL